MSKTDQLDVAVLRHTMFTEKYIVKFASVVIGCDCNIQDIV